MDAKSLLAHNIKQLINIIAELHTKSKPAIAQKKKVKPMLISHIGLPNMATLTVRGGNDEVNTMISRPVKTASPSSKQYPSGASVTCNIDKVLSHSCTEYWAERSVEDPLAFSDILHIATTANIHSIDSAICIEPSITVRDVLSFFEHIIRQQRSLVLDIFSFAIDYMPQEWKAIFPDIPIRRQTSASDLLDTESFTRHSNRMIETKRFGPSQRIPDAEFLYANRQKVADMFMCYLAESRSSTESGFKPARKAVNVKEIFVKLDRRNMVWFADFVLSEFVKSGSSPSAQESQPFDKLAKLERRISQVDRRVEDQDHVFFTFITTMDSNSLNKSLWSVCAKKLEVVNVETRSSKFVAYCREIKKAVNLMRHLAVSMDQQESCRALLMNVAKNSIINGQLSVHIWWLCQNPDVLDDDLSSFLNDYVANSVQLTNLNRLIFASVLEECLVMKSSKPQLRDTTSQQDTIDNDRSLSLAIVDLGREHCDSWSRLYKYCTEGICSLANSTTQLRSSSMGSSSSSSDAVSLRKIRPFTELSGEAFEEMKLQKRLRRWFWWMYPGLKDAVESLCTYLVLNHATCGSDQEERRAKLMACIPSLTPVIWNCLGEGRAELVSLLEQLSVELLERLASPTTSTFDT